MEFEKLLGEVEILRQREKEGRYMYSLCGWGMSFPYWSDNPHHEGRYKTATVTCRVYAPGKCAIDVKPGEKV